MLKRRVPRVLATGFLLAVAVSGLSACRTAPNVAAYVGDAQVTVAELDAAVAERLADEDVAAFAEGNEEAFTRRVLALLVQEEVYAAAAERYDVQVGNDEVRARIDELLGDDDPEDVYSQLAEQGIGREDVFENVRQQLVRREVAAAEGAADGLDDAALQARYDEVRRPWPRCRSATSRSPTRPRPTPCWPQLTADPASYATVAARYPGPYTLPALEAAAADEIPAVLAEGIAAAQPEHRLHHGRPRGRAASSSPSSRARSTRRSRRSGPSWSRRPPTPADQAGDVRIDDVRNDLGVTVNPRFGALEDGQLVDGDGGVVDILDDDAADAAGDPPATPGRVGPARASRRLTGCPSRPSSPSAPVCPAC